MMDVKLAVHNLLKALGEDPKREGLVETPDRVARMFAKCLMGRLEEIPTIKTFDEPTDEVVMVSHIPFFSYCEHHLVPFVGKAAIAYLPGKRVAGLSKLIRLFRHFCKCITIQERLTIQTADALMDQLDPQGVLVVVQAEHMCMTMRGVRAPGSLTTTSAARGVFLKNDILRTQFMEQMLK